MSKQTGVFKVDKECKHSRRYASREDDFPVRSVYVSREWPGIGRDSIVVTIEEPEGRGARGAEALAEVAG